MAVDSGFSTGPSGRDPEASGGATSTPESATLSVAARVYLVRHGETEHNRQGIMQGHLDVPLNATGVAQARLAADALADVPLTAAYSSDLQRARKVRGCSTGGGAG